MVALRVARLLSSLIECLFVFGLQASVSGRVLLCKVIRDTNTPSDLLSSGVLC